MDAPTFISVTDDSGAEMKVGEWLMPDAENPFWRLRLSVAELVLQLVAPGTPMPIERYIAEPTPLLTENMVPDLGLVDKLRPKQEGVNLGLAARRKLREKVAALADKKAAKEAAMTTPTTPTTPDALGVQSSSATPQLGYKLCADCGKSSPEMAYKPCAQCGEDKCRTCIPDPDGERTCLACQALNAEPEDGGFDPNARPKETAEDRRLRLAQETADKLDGVSSNPNASRLFDNKYHPKLDAAATEPVIEDDDDEG